MGDRMRLLITGAVAAAAVGVTVSGHGLWSMIQDDEEISATVPLAALKGFDGITQESPDDVVVTPGDHYAVTLEGHKDAARLMNLYVKDGALHVDRRSHSGWGGNSNVTVHVTMPGLSRLWLSGSGDVRVEKFAGKQLRALVVGSGDLQVDDVMADDIAVTVRGSGDVRMAGATKALNIQLFGSGDVSVDDLQAQSADVSIFGSGSVTAHASQNARLTVTGSGEAHVSGTTQCQISKTGSGEAECTT